MATMLESCRIFPSSSSSSSSNQEFCTPLTHFDIPFLQSDPTQRLIFFDFHCSKPHFHENILPSLKISLALTLTRFLPLAGNILLPLNSGNPVASYVSGDSVSLTIAQSDQNIHYLTSNHQRVADDFYGCVPQLPPATRCAESVICPVVALRITLFPGKGICIGITNHHAVCDGSSTVEFVKAWASANRSGDAEAFYRTVGVRMPVLDRTLVADPERLDSMAWKIARNRDHLPIELPPTVEFPINRVRSTFLMRIDGEPWKQPLPVDDDTVVLEISHLGQVKMLATNECKSKSYLDPSSLPSSPMSQNDDDKDSDKEEESGGDERRKFGAADTFRIPEDVDISRIS